MEKLGLQSPYLNQLTHEDCLVRVEKFIHQFEATTPLHLAASWDNVGWQVEPGIALEEARVLVCLTPTFSVLEEAADEGFNLVFAHHPLIFTPLKSLHPKTPVGQAVHLAYTKGIGVYSAHTNFDQVVEGTADTLSTLLGLSACEPLEPYPEKFFKLVTFVPADAREVVLETLWEAGAGQVGEHYNRCSYWSAGTGTFCALEGSHPAIGVAGDNQVAEDRLEVLVSETCRSTVLQALQLAHPYEEPAYELYAVEPPASAIGYGRVGLLPEPQTLEEALQLIRLQLDQPHLITSPAALDRKVHKVAVLGGSGGSFIPQAHRHQVDLYLTSDCKFHQFQEAMERSIVLVDAGHYATERPACKRLVERFQAWGVQARLSSQDRDYIVHSLPSL
jgi:dinuclear metal center YbgI/SA1388 family protein